MNTEYFRLKPEFCVLGFPIVRLYEKRRKFYSPLPPLAQQSTFLAPFAQQYGPEPPFSQQSGLLAPLAQQYFPVMGENIGQKLILFST